MKIFSVCFICLFLIDCAGTSVMQLNREEQDYLMKARRCSTTFSIPQEDASIAWGRAQSWIAKYSSMKLQVVTDYVLQTYNPGGWGVSFGYYVIRTDLGDSLEIKVECLTDNIFTGNDRKQNEYLLAYYIQTGEEPPNARIIAK